MVKITDSFGNQGFQMDIFDFTPKKSRLKKYWYRCKKVSTGEDIEIGVLATSFKKAEELFEGQKEYIPLEYTGWTSLDNEK